MIVETAISENNREKSASPPVAPVYGGQLREKKPPLAPKELPAVPIDEWQQKTDQLFDVLFAARRVPEFQNAEDVQKCLAALYALEELAFTDRDAARVKAREVRDKFMERFMRVAETLKGLYLEGTSLKVAALDVFGDDLTDESRERLEIARDVETLEL